MSAEIDLLNSFRTLRIAHQHTFVRVAARKLKIASDERCSACFFCCFYLLSFISFLLSAFLSITPGAQGGFKGEKVNNVLHCT